MTEIGAQLAELTRLRSALAERSRERTKPCPLGQCPRIIEALSQASPRAESLRQRRESGARGGK